MGSSNPGEFDGRSFLDHLRRMNEQSVGSTEDPPIVSSSNDNTINAGNTKNSKNHERLQDLFQAPQDESLSRSNNDKNKDAISASTEDALSSFSNKGQLPPPPPPPPPPQTSDTHSLERPPLKKSVTTTAVPPSHPKPPTVMTGGGHNRKVSWSAGLMPSSSSPNSQKSLRKLNNVLDNPTNNTSSSRDLLVNPFEAEAETALLKAIEEQQQQSRRFRSDTGTSTIFSQLPDDDDDNNNDDQERHEFVMENTPSHRHLSDENEDRSQQSRPLLKNSRAASSSRISRRHNRTLSVEQTLAELATAFSAMDQGQRRRSRYGNDNKNHTRFQSSADELAHNGLRLIDGNENSSSNGSSTDDGAVDNHNNILQTSSSTESSASSSASRWATVKKHLPRLREEMEETMTGLDNNEIDRDDDSADDDIELGDNGGGDDDNNKNNNNNGIENTHDGSNNNNVNDDNDVAQSARRKKRRRATTVVNDKFKEDWQKWTEFFRPHKGRFYAYVKTVLLFILVPMVIVAAILFYLTENPPTGTTNDPGNNDTSTKASASYILLFCCRQLITFSMAVALQGIVIDFLALNTRVLLRAVGPVITLLIVQSKGWPHILFWWSILDYSMLSGSSAFANHWMFYQDLIDLFNATNPSGNIASNEWYLRSLAVALSLSIVVAVKRFVVGIYLGRQQYSHYGGQLAKIMSKMFLVSEVASLAKHLEKTKSPMPTQHLSWGEGDFATETDDGDTINQSPSFGTSRGPADNIIDTDNRDPLTGSLHFSEKVKLMQLLDQWEEPETRHDANNEITSISAVLRYRKALTFIQKRYPFSYEFGEANSREACIDSAQKVYGRLMKHSVTPALQFEVIALCAVDEEGRLDQDKGKQLMKVFRPDREGNLTMLDFVKSIDVVYKEFRMLQATIDNSGRIDKAFENIFNVVFYLIAFICILAALNLDPLALFLSLSSVILAFAFVIGNASSKYFEGVLFILARRPYGIGDLIQVSNIEQDGSLHGALPWCVENVTLFETVVCFLPTNERASLSNGSLANSRIINWARSPQAQFHIFLNFPLDTPYEKLLLFKSAVEEYMKARPREWRALNGFRANRVVANENYIEWLVVIQHREAWQQVGQVLDSKANLSSYCNEVARQLGMEYQAPRLPVELRHADPNSPGAGTETNQLDSEALTQNFQALAREKHQIRVC